MEKSLNGEGIKAEVKIRSTQPGVPATIFAREGGAEVVFAEPQAAVSPGQACVIYDGARVLGGGWIAK